jgi:hypothetical protein
MNINHGGKHNERVVITTAFPAATARSVPHISRFIFASTPEENSSMSTTAGLPMSAIASASFRWLPPLKRLASRSAYPASPAATNIASTLLLSSVPGRRPLSRPYTSKCSRTESCASTAVNCGQTPSESRAACGWDTIETSLIRICPVVGGISPPRSMSAQQS